MIAEALAGKRVAITGATGFLGTALVERLLRSVPECELVLLIRANPGKYSFAGPGVGSTPHLGGELFRLAFNLDLVHVPFSATGPAVTLVDARTGQELKELRPAK